MVCKGASTGSVPAEERTHAVWSRRRPRVLPTSRPSPGKGAGASPDLGRDVVSIDIEQRREKGHHRGVIFGSGIVKTAHDEDKEYTERKKTIVHIAPLNPSVTLARSSLPSKT